VKKKCGPSGRTHHGVERHSSRNTSGLILSQHLTIVTIIFLVVHLVDGHAIGLCGDVAHLVAFFGFVVHGLYAVIAGALLCLTIRVEEDAETGYADPAKDTKYVALVFVEFGWGFAAENEQIVAEKGLDASETEVGEARAVV
jgi:hypothetical protein